MTKAIVVTVLVAIVALGSYMFYQGQKEDLGSLGVTAAGFTD